MKTLSLALALCAVLSTGLYAYDLANTSPAQLSSLLHIRQIQPPPFTLNEVIRAAAMKHGIQPSFVKSIIRAESGFDQEALSSKGAIGLMQLMPETAEEYGVDPKDAAQNIDGGAHYLSWLLARYSRHKDQLPRAIAAYNAGPGNVDKYKGIPPFSETRTYVKRVLGYFRSYEGSAVMAKARSVRRPRVTEAVDDGT
jgi:soluble lytic murein transglycosylase-like protein